MVCVQFGKIIKLGLPVSLRTFRYSFRSSQPSTRSFFAFSINTPHSAKRSAALRPVSCRRFQRSGGAKVIASRSTSSERSNMAFAASDKISPS